MDVCTSSDGRSIAGCSGRYQRHEAMSFEWVWLGSSAQMFARFPHPPIKLS